MSTVKKGCVPQWCLSDKKKCVSTVFQEWRKACSKYKKKVFLKDSDKKGVLMVF